MAGGTCLRFRWWGGARGPRSPRCGTCWSARFERLAAAVVIDIEAIHTKRLFKVLAFYEMRAFIKMQDGGRREGTHRLCSASLESFRD